jgi:hypothetical protein
MTIGKQSALIGKHVIVRSNLAGVFFGVLSAKNGDELTLSNARKFYRFSGANTVEDLAAQGALNPSGCKMTIQVDEIVISKFEQILPCTKEAVKQNNSIRLAL